MLRVVWSSDFHLGLTTGEIDRTDEIVDILLYIAHYSKKIKADAVVLGGDIFHKNNPSEELIAKFILVMNAFAECECNIYVIVGNHDSVPNPNRLSCLSFIGKLKKKYPKFHLISDIKCIEFKVTDIGPVYFTFYPHITKSVLERYAPKNKLTTQQYIDNKTKKIFKKVGNGSYNYVFSHLNIKDVIPGSEENLLKKSEVYLPESLNMAQENFGILPPIVIQGHIHKRQDIDNIHIVGSPLHVEFGEHDTEKFFLDIHIPNSFNEKGALKYIPTECTKFFSLEIELIKKVSKGFLDLKKVKKFINSIPPKSIIKIEPTLSGDNAVFNWDQIREEIAKKTNSYVKPIVPKIIKHKVTRNKEQTANLNPFEALKVWFRSNKPPRVQERYKHAKKILTESLENDIQDTRKNTYNDVGELKIHSLKLTNFMGFKHFSRNFYDKNVIGIIGEFSEDSRKSNTAGKTTIVEAIKYALDGTSRAEKDTELIRYGQEVMEVELVLTDGKNKFKIRRGRTDKNIGVLELDWIEKTREAQAEIDSLVGFSKGEFDLTIFFKQSDINQFMELGSSKQKEHLIKWFKTTHWIDAEKLAKEKLKTKHKKLEKLENEIDILKKTFENDVDIKTNLETEEVGLKRIENNLDKATVVLKLLDKKQTITKKEFEKYNKYLEESEEEMLNINEELNKIKGLAKYILECKRTDRTLESRKQKLKDRIKSSLTKLQNHKAEINQHIKELNHKVIETSKNRCGICPILNESCDRIEPDREEKELWNRDIESDRNTLARIERQILDHTSLGLVQDEILKNKFRQVKFLERKGKKDNFEHEKLELQKTIDSLTEDIENYDEKLFIKIIKAKDIILEIKEEIGESNRNIGSLKNKLENARNNRKKVKELKIEIVNISEKVDDLKYIILTFGKNGIPSQEIENGFSELEDESNYILEKFGTKSELMLLPNRETNKWEPSCLSCGFIFPKNFKKQTCPECETEKQKQKKDELQLKVIKEDKEYSFYMDSVGGKTLLSVAIRMALTQLKRRMDNSRFNVIIMDEPDASLDEFNCDQFMKLVTGVLIKELGIAQVFWISHNKSIQNSLPHVLKVLNNGEYAKASWI